MKKSEGLMTNRFSAMQNTNKGILAVDVYDRNVGQPIQNAVVKVYPHSEGEELTGQIEELITNEAGQTAEIEVNTPDIELSLVPEQVVQPYAQYDMEITADGMMPVIIRGVQALAEVTALQQVDMTPIQRQMRQDHPPVSEQIIIQPHTLWGDYAPKIPEEEIKDVSDPGFVVLDQPVVPEYIVVHDGGPDNAAAADYWIPYKDYVKNVASSEIYATWPANTIRANVLAIISFTLNRVYTEWYRNKGKNFTISSSTAYDHKFIYGRNIYSEISQIVDEIFNNYISRPSIKQPLFTQYCDGRKVQCPNWMTQWGSKSLGDQGYSTMNILKNYYGYDIYLDTAEQVIGVPSSYPGYPLTMGMRGNDVRTIQTQLNTISKNYPAIQKVAADGVFGESTKAAVEAFQKAFRMTQDGVVGKSTWYRISDVFVAVSKMS